MEMKSQINGEVELHWNKIRSIYGQKNLHRLDVRCGSL